MLRWAATAGTPAHTIFKVAAASSWWSAGGSSRLFSTAGEGAAPPPPPPPQPAEEERAASLPVEQLAKALLAGNVRGQLTTITAAEPGADESKVSSSVASYLSPKGEAPVVLLTRADAEHLRNLGESAKASLATGHITPPWFIQRLRATGWLPRRVALLGRLEELPAGDVRWAVEQARKACGAGGGAAALASLLPGEEQLGELLGFRMTDISQAVYVDAAGKQHPVAPEELDSSFLDPLALGQHDLLATLNQEPQWQAQLQLFCAAYLGVHASEVLLVEADRQGFSLLGRPAAGGEGGQQQPGQQQGQGQGQEQRWRQFRIGSSRELRSQQQFMELLDQMKAEVLAAAGA